MREILTFAFIVICSKLITIKLLEIHKLKDIEGLEVGGGFVSGSSTIKLP